MIRKMHLAKLLMEGDIDGIKSDFNNMPINGIDGNASLECIYSTLEKYGIFKDRLVLWGTGSPLREFLWSEDMADASIHILENVSFVDLKGGSPEIRNCHINIGTGKEISIKDLAYIIKDEIKYNGEIHWDNTKPDGTMRKLCDVSKLHSLGWKHTIEIGEGIHRLYSWYISQ
jgi:GDP-L-fucose synthase